MIVLFMVVIMVMIAMLLVVIMAFGDVRLSSNDALFAFTEKPAGPDIIKPLFKRTSGDQSIVAVKQSIII